MGIFLHFVTDRLETDTDLHFYPRVTFLKENA